MYPLERCYTSSARLVPSSLFPSCIAIIVCTRRRWRWSQRERERERERNQVQLHAMTRILSAHSEMITLTQAVGSVISVDELPVRTSAYEVCACACISMSNTRTRGRTISKVACSKASRATRTFLWEIQQRCERVSKRPVFFKHVITTASSFAQS